ncbi:MAG: LPS assembly protein LptD [Smithellaceae bacterium]|nr:LPS assembly protein LptD [Smithellaceae bacterium]
MAAKYLRIQLLLIGLLLFEIGPAIAAESTEKNPPVSIEADVLSYDQKTDSYTADGNVVVTFGDSKLKADFVDVNRRTNEAVAQGHVWLQSGNDILEGRKLFYDINTQSGLLAEGKLFAAKNHFYLRGDIIEKQGPATYHVEDATATSCDGAFPDWSFKSRDLQVTVDGYGTMKHGRFLVKGVPVFYLPYLIFPAKTTRQSGFLLPRLSYSRDQHGVDVEVPFFWAISDSMDATFYQRYMDKRGWMEGAEFRYWLGEGSGGTIYGDYLNDAKHAKDELNGLTRDWPDGRKRWSFFVNNETRWDSGLYLRADVTRVSDSWYFRDFSGHNYYLDHFNAEGQEPFKQVSFQGNESLGRLDSAVRLVKNWTFYNFTALASNTQDLLQDGDGNVLQRYPELTLAGLRQPLGGSPLQASFSAAYDYYYRDQGDRGNLWQIKSDVYLPLRLGKFLQLTPRAGIVSAVWQSDETIAGGAARRGDQESVTAGATLSTEVQRVYTLPSSTLPKLKHTIRPEISYDYNTLIAEKDLPGYAPANEERNELTYGITNILTAKWTDKSGASTYREFLRLKLFQSYDIREVRREIDPLIPTDERHPFGIIGGELDFTPCPYVTLSSRDRFDAEEGRWIQSNHDLTLTDGRGDKAVFGYRYTADTLEEVNLSLRAVLTSRIEANYALKKNLRDEETVENSLGLIYHKQCWSVSVVYADASNDRSYSVSVSLAGL